MARRGSGLLSPAGVVVGRRGRTLLTAGPRAASKLPAAAKETTTGEESKESGHPRGIVAPSAVEQPRDRVASKLSRV